MQVIDFGELGRERAGVDDTLHPVARCTHRRVRQRLAQVQMVDDDVRDRTLPRRGSTIHGTFRITRPGQGVRPLCTKLANAFRRGWWCRRQVRRATRWSRGRSI